MPEAAAFFELFSIHSAGAPLCWQGDRTETIHPVA
jgi:hypothetical protein